jgi:hypothetical protein
MDSADSDLVISCPVYFSLFLEVYDMSIFGTNRNSARKTMQLIALQVLTIEFVCYKVHDGGCCYQ